MKQRKGKREVWLSFILTHRVTISSPHSVTFSLNVPHSPAASPSLPLPPTTSHSLPQTNSASSSLFLKSLKHKGLGPVLKLVLFLKFCLNISKKHF